MKRPIHLLAIALLPTAALAAESFRDAQKYGDCLVKRGVEIARQRGVSAERAAVLAQAHCKFTGKEADLGEGGFEDGVIYTIQQKLGKAR